MKSLSQYLALLISMVAALQSQAAETAGSTVQGKLLASVPISSRVPLLLVPVTLGTNHCAFALDTGSPFDVLDHSLKHHLGTPLDNSQFISRDHDQAFQAFRHPGMVMAGIPYTNSQPVLCLDLGGLRREYEVEVMGLIGAPFLQGRVLELDFECSILRVYEPPISIHGSGYRKVPLLTRDGMPLVAAYPGSRSALFRLDTGYWGLGTLDMDTATKLKQAAQLNVVGTEYFATALGDKYAVTRVLLHELRFRDFEFNDQLFMVTKGTDFGLLFLRKFHSVLDLDRGSLWVKPGRHFHDPLALPSLGVILTHSKNVARVLHLLDEPSSDVAALMKGDALVGIEGITLTSEPLKQLDLFSRTNRKERIEVMVERHGERRTLNLSLRVRPD